jgi:O-antigen/teichoic acid export membrane protein
MPDKQHIYEELFIMGLATTILFFLIYSLITNYFYSLYYTLKSIVISEIMKLLIIPVIIFAMYKFYQHIKDKKQQKEWSKQYVRMLN